MRTTHANPKTRGDSTTFCAKTTHVIPTGVLASFASTQRRDRGNNPHSPVANPIARQSSANLCVLSVSALSVLFAFRVPLATSAVGAAQVSPARKRWENSRTPAKRRRCDTPVFHAHQAKPVIPNEVCEARTSTPSRELCARNPSSILASCHLPNLHASLPDIRYPISDIYSPESPCLN